ISVVADQSPIIISLLQVMDIKKQDVIGVGSEGVENFKNGRLCWLQIATKNKVYLFDILLLGALAFKNGLSMILESKQILKVIHDCRAIAGSLTVQFRVKITHVFDTQVADVMCFHSKTGGFLPDRVSTLPEVVSLYLKVPSSRLASLRLRSQLTKVRHSFSSQRPCPLPLLKVMALSVMHLKPLRLMLLDTLMTDYMVLVDSYLNSSVYEPDVLEVLLKRSLPLNFFQHFSRYNRTPQCILFQFYVIGTTLLVGLSLTKENDCRKTKTNCGM
uniref:3'-5' exonuclease domain-containing protein n=1 Tax=Fundulus heteroclitus TaxID=8078 RepID=A0A3Q2PHW5_FUNHE